MRKKWKWFVYILLCKDGSYYTGRSWRVDLRYDQHTSGLGGLYTREHGVDKLVYYEEHENFETARQREKQIQGWTRAKKEKLIRGEWSGNW